MEKNYYLILGVSSTASLEEIKSAFRRRAMELHPDHSGRESEPFLEIQEAYGVLSDPERRRSYDRQSQVIPVRRAPRGPAAEPLVGRHSKIEPLKPRARAYDTISGSFDNYRPSFEELFARFWNNFENGLRPKAERAESLTLEAVLNPDEAIHGGTIRLQIPGLAICPACGGQAATGFYECWRCQGDGALAGYYPVEIRFHPHIKDGHTIRFSLRRFGIENFCLIVLFRVLGAERGVDEL